ncbi:MAG: hypothetical protein OER04_09885 [Cyclobacteriaceae bacterium]|nr:hypothetical protein [Cyclobacteriaceae bacterium]
MLINKKFKILRISATILLVLFSINLTAQDDGDPEDNWEFVVAPYIFFTSLTGDAGVGVTGSTEVSADFSDLLKVLEFGFMFHGEVQKGDWGGMIDITFAKVGDDLSVARNGIADVEAKLAIIEAFGNHRFVREWGHIDAFAGVRFWDIDLDMSLDLGGGLFTGDITRGDSYVDPVIGGRVLYNFSDTWFAMLRSDIGGFGVGSDFSFNVQPSLGYRFTDTFSLVGQYRYLTTDFSSGTSGTTDYFLLDINLHGPLVGFVFQF